MQICVESRSMAEADIVYVEDKGGDKIKFRRDGQLLVPPSFPGNRVEHVVNFKLRDDDVLIAGWPRSGTHWAWEMINMMVKKKAETIPKFKEDNMFEYQSVSGLDNLPSPRILNTHLQVKLLPADIKTKPIKVIYLLRNPRDAHVSWYRCYIGHSPMEYKGKFCNWLPVHLEGKLDWGSWFDHVRAWERDFESHPNLKVHYLQYEEVLKDPLGEMQKVRDFLEYDVNESLLREIVDKCHIDRMREDKKKYEWSEDGQLHYNKGKAGTWKSMFTVEDYELFEKMYRETMAGSKFEQLYQGPVDVL